MGIVTDEIPPRLGFYEVEKEVDNNTLAALEVFEGLGATVEEVEINWTTDIQEAVMAYLNHLFVHAMCQSYFQYGDLLTSYAMDFALHGKNSTNEEFWNSYNIAGKMYWTIGQLLCKYHLLVCPTNNLTSVPADHNQSKFTVIVNGKQLNPELGWGMTLLFNMLSRCPVISIPSGRRRDNVPTGIQLVGLGYEVARVIQAAFAYRAEFKRWYVHPDNRPSLVNEE